MTYSIKTNTQPTHPAVLDPGMAPCIQRMVPNLLIDDVPTLRSDRQALQRSRLLKSVVDGPWRSRGTSLEVHGKKSPNKFTWFLEFFWIDALSVENYSKEISLPILARGSTYLSRKSCPIPSGNTWFCWEVQGSNKKIGMTPPPFRKCNPIFLKEIPWPYKLP